MSSWDLAPTLEGAIVRLEPLRRRHRHEMAETAAVPEIWSDWFYDLSQGEAFDTWFFSRLLAAGKDESFHFATVAVASGAIIGSTGFTNIREHDRGLEIGWSWLHPSAWGTGANVEAKLLQLRYAFEELGCVRIAFDTDADNQRSRTAISALPAQFEGIARNFQIRPSDGSKRSFAFYAITDDDWPAVRENLERRLASHFAQTRHPQGD